MTDKNSIHYLSLTSTIFELDKVGNTKLADKLKNILANEELPKPSKHNKKGDKTTSYYKVTITEEDLETIVDLFHDLEVKNLGKDYEVTGAASTYASMADLWESIETTN